MHSINISYLHDEPGSAHYTNINFSPVKARKRITMANNLLGKYVVRWIIGFALFLLGAKRKVVSDLLGIPYETLNSFIRRTWKDGIKALEDRRTSRSEATPQATTEPAVCAPTAPTAPTAMIQEDEVVVHFPSDSSVSIPIPHSNKVVAKAFLLTLLDNQLLDSQRVAHILGYAPNHVHYLKRKMIAGSPEVLFDGRRGPKQDYVFKSEIKAQLILQSSVNAITGKSTTSQALASDLKERCGLDLSPRSIRDHIQKLGLKNIDVTLPEIIERLKKNSGK